MLHAGAAGQQRLHKASKGRVREDDRILRREARRIFGIGCRGCRARSGAGPVRVINSTASPREWAECGSAGMLQARTRGGAAGEASPMLRWPQAQGQAC